MIDFKLFGYGKDSFFVSFFYFSKKKTLQLEYNFFENVGRELVEKKKEEGKEEGKEGGGVVGGGGWGDT